MGRTWVVLATIVLLQLFDFINLKHSEIMQKKIKQFYYDSAMVHFCKGCDVNMFLFSEIIEAAAFLSQKGGQK